MNIRKITAMTMFISFILLVLTSVILYIVPHGRVAYWTDYHFWSLTKGEWSNLHINLGLLFIFGGLLHIFYNWAPIKAYMKNKSRELKVFTPSFNVALLLSLVVGVGTYLEIPPMSTVINFSESIKEAASERFGEPPYGHAELSSLELFSKKQNLDLDKALQLLHKSNIKVGDAGITLAVLAADNGLSPQGIYEIIKPASTIKKGEGNVSFPDSPMAGFGNMTLGAICSEFNLMYQVVRRNLSEIGVTAEAEMTIKEIAAENGKDPVAIFEILRGIANEIQTR